jgi:hypothetical protein
VFNVTGADGWDRVVDDLQKAQGESIEGTIF